MSNLDEAAAASAAHMAMSAAATLGNSSTCKREKKKKMKSISSAFFTSVGITAQIAAGALAAAVETRQTVEMVVTCIRWLRGELLALESTYQDESHMARQLLMESNAREQLSLTQLAAAEKSLKNLHANASSRMAKQHYSARHMFGRLSDDIDVLRTEIWDMETQLETTRAELCEAHTKIATVERANKHLLCEKEASDQNLVHTKAVNLEEKVAMMGRRWMLQNRFGSIGPHAVARAFTESSIVRDEARADIDIHQNITNATINKYHWQTCALKLTIEEQRRVIHRSKESASAAHARAYEERKRAVAAARQIRLHAQRADTAERLAASANAATEEVWKLISPATLASCKVIQCKDFTKARQRPALNCMKTRKKHTQRISNSSINEPIQNENFNQDAILHIDDDSNLQQPIFGGTWNEIDCPEPLINDLPGTSATTQDTKPQALTSKNCSPQIGKELDGNDHNLTRTGRSASIPSIITNSRKSSIKASAQTAHSIASKAVEALQPSAIRRETAMRRCDSSTEDTLRSSASRNSGLVIESEMIAQSQSNDEPLVLMAIPIKDGVVRCLAVHAHDDPVDLADRFAQTHELDAEAQQHLVGVIRRQIKIRTRDPVVILGIDVGRSQVENIFVYDDDSPQVKKSLPLVFAFFSSSSSSHQAFSCEFNRRSLKSL